MKKILITGAATGLGLDTAKYLLAKGMHVYAAMRNCNERNAESVNALKLYAENVAGRISIIELDVTSQNDIKLVADVFSKSGLDCLINNAGLGALGFIESFSLEQVKKVFDVNVFGPFSLSKALLPMLAMKNGLIINISSAGGRLCFPFLGVYNASKFALEGMMESWNIETKSLGVDVCLIEPGAYPTELHSKRLVPSHQDVLEKYGDVANAPEQMVEGMAAAFDSLENPPDPVEISDAVWQLILSPSENRPVRQVIGTVATDGIKELNELNEEIQNDLIKTFGL